jgi:hypothetical protein
VLLIVKDPSWDLQRAMGGRKDEAKKKKPTPEMQVITESEEKNDTEESEDDAKKGCNYGALKRCNHPSFDDTKDASIAQPWLRKIKAVFASANVRRNRK